MKRTRQALLAAAFLAAARLAVSCGAGAPSDDTWMKIRTFSEDGEAINILNSNLEDGISDVVDIELINLSTDAQGNGPGIGISLRRVKVDYTFRNFDNFNNFQTIY